MKRPRLPRLATLLAALAAGSGATAHAQTPASDSGAKWVVDVLHSQIDFRVRHLLGRVRGTFTNWYAVIETRGPDWRQGTVSVTVQTASLNTGNAYRDADLRSNRFFAADIFPRILFEGTGIVATDSTVELSGILTIKGRSHPVTFRGQYRGVARDPEGHERIAFEASAVVDRRDYGITWNEIVDGNSLIGNEVEIIIALEAVRVP
jgi:polyisoprenoid-binding protein YceI